MSLYNATLSQIERLPAAVRVSVILRHSERQPILRPEETLTAMLTARGVQQAEEFGQALAALRQPGRILTSPVVRCRDTAAAIVRGAAWKAAATVDYRLSHPFIAPAWNALPIRWGKDPIPSQLVALLHMVMEFEEKPGSVDIYCTHDTIVAALAGYFFGCIFVYPDYWPDYLEGVFFWRQDGQVHMRWRTHECVITPWPDPAFYQLQLAF